MEDERHSFLSGNKTEANNFSEFGVELKSFTNCLKWVCVDQSNIWKAFLSWSIFLLLAVGCPLVSHFVFLCSTCDTNHQRPYDAVVQLSLSVFAAISFISLSSWSRKYGVNRFLFLDKLPYESDKVRRGYAVQLRVCFFFLYFLYSNQLIEALNSSLMKSIFFLNLFSIIQICLNNCMIPFNNYCNIGH